LPTRVKGSRTYTTTLRREHAGLTRRRVLEAARPRFIDQGFPAVTMHDIAADAGVAYQTVYSQFGNKLELALELCNADLLHVGPTVAAIQQTRAAGDAYAFLLALGPFARRLYEPCAEVLRFMRESGDPALLGRYREIGQARLELLKPLGPQLQRSRRLRRGLTAKHAVDLVWTLTGPETYECLVVDQGWSPDEFETWLRASLVLLVMTRP
jgi:AcrR family transcriptional regulator